MAINHLVIVGPTAGGKTSLSLKLAKKYDGEIIAADSRTVYKEMNIGTAKPTRKEQLGIKHYCLDLVYPNQPFTAADFKHHANLALTEIYRKDKIAITVGGSGLYINSFVYNYSLANHDTGVLQTYKDESIDNLQKIILDKGLSMPENSKNKRYLLNTLARGNNIASSIDILPATTLIVGINPNNEELKNNIKLRADIMFNNGVIEEVKDLNARYGKGCRAMQGGIYKVLQEYLEGKEPIDIAKERVMNFDWQLARRQRTWFKRNKDIVWFESGQQAESWLAERFKGKL